MDVKAKRRYKRFSTGEENLTANLLFDTATVLDISSGGACIIVDKYMHIGKKFSFKFKCKERVLSLNASVVWSRIFNLKDNGDGDIVPAYMTGIEFNETLDSKGIDITDIVNQIY
jgi:hypothetical protein